MNKSILILMLGGVMIISCKKKGCTDISAQNYNFEAERDDGSCTFYEVPSTYIFTDFSGNNTVSYSGQTDRLNQLEELTAYMKTAKTNAIDASVMKAMYWNLGDNGGGNFSFSSSKQLADKCFPADSAVFTGWFDSLENVSMSFASTASNAEAGTLTSGSTTYLFDANGIEYVQFIEKGLMGAVLMYQATQVYFGSGKINVDNTTALDSDAGKYYTEMEHHWDEAFGYFGVPIDFPNSTENERFWGKYCHQRDAQLGSNTGMMNAFLRGRTAIVNHDLIRRDIEILAARRMWEKVCAAQAVSYLKGAKDCFGSDNAKFLHQLSEAYVFIMNLRYLPLETRIIQFSEIDTLINTTIGGNFWNVTTIDLINAIDQLNTIYGF